MIDRHIISAIAHDLDHYPVTAIVGSRQVGKSTLVKSLLGKTKEVLFLDMERPSDARKLEDAELFLETQKDKLVCMDEVQYRPDLFPVMRVLVDEWKGKGHFLITGSASPELLRQSSESLAGRISYHTLTPFLWSEVNQKIALSEYLLKGGFPRSVLEKDDMDSYRWRQNFILTFLERDLSFWSGYSVEVMRRLWQMLAHLNGQQLNYSNIGNSLSVSNMTVRHYIDLLASTFMVNLISPFFKNTGKRLVKSPKMYVADAGLTHALLGIENYDQLMGHPVIGYSWESLVLNNLMSHFGRDIYYYRTSHGAEVDFVLAYKCKTYVVECKHTLAPKLTRGNYNAIRDIDPDFTLVVAPVKEGWPMAGNISVVSLSELTSRISGIAG